MREERGTGSGVSGLGEEEGERKRWRRPCLQLVVHVPVRNDGRRKIGWAEKIWALVEEIGPKEKGKEKNTKTRWAVLSCCLAPVRDFEREIYWVKLDSLGIRIEI